MSTTTIQSTPGFSGHDADTAQGFSDDVILNEWLSSDPAPGTYIEYRKNYLACRRGS